MKARAAWQFNMCLSWNVNRNIDKNSNVLEDAVGNAGSWIVLVRISLERRVPMAQPVLNFVFWFDTSKAGFMNCKSDVTQKEVFAFDCRKFVN